jgi:DNA-binding NarL/FixJ family response regulator
MPVRVPAGPAGLDELTEAESKVIELMAEGLSNGAIARRLHLSVRTVECYVRSIFLKLGLMPDTARHRRVSAVLIYLGSPSVVPRTLTAA